MANNTFQNTGSVRPSKSVFDLSYSKLFTADMGQLIPIMCDEVVPGDKWEIGNELVIRLQPLVAPVLHKITAFVHFFFVPYRIIDDDWEEIITGGRNGDSTVPLPRFVPELADTSKGTLWDYFGLPTGVVPVGATPLVYPWRAYNRIWNEYYRDQNFMNEIDEEQNEVLRRCWRKDYFTSALPWQQRGTAPALPITGTSFADFTAAVQPYLAGTTGINFGAATESLRPSSAVAEAGLLAALNNNTVDLSSATTFNPSDLRLAFQTQLWLERNARAGARYKEFIQAHYDETLEDFRAQRPEYIGGCTTPVIVSEVLQTSSTDATTPQGNMAGHGIAADRNTCAVYKAREFGLIMGILSVMPEAMYQQGIDRQWLRRSRFDFPFPEFVNLSEQAIEQCEIMAADTEIENRAIFGYQGRYDELRVKRNLVCGDMRDTFAYWHLGRVFDPGTPPTLNADFLTCEPDKRIFAVPSEPGLICQVGNIIRAVRPIPITAEPGLIDHS